MASTVDSVVRTPAAFRTQSPAELAAVPWYVWSLFAAVVSVVIGGYWDISWHMSIGRDSFWTPAHMAIQLCGILAGFTCGYLILSCTFGRNPELGVGQRQRMEIPRAARRLHCRLGWRHHARLRAFR